MWLRYVVLVSFSLNLRRALSYLLMAFVPTVILAQQSSEQATQQQLLRLRQEIQSVEKSLQANRDDKSALQKQLRLNEIHVSKLSRLIRSTDTDIQRQASRLATMRSDKDTLNKQLTQYRQQLALQLRSAHALGQQEYLKILLSAQNPTEISRMLTYLNYLSKQQLQLIQQAKLSYKKLQTTETKIIKRRQALTADRARQQADLDKLTQSKQNRTRLIAKLGQQITSKKQRLQILKNDQLALNKLLSRFVQRQPGDIPAPPSIDAPPPFKSLKGKLLQPTMGKVLRKYGQRHFGNLTSNGMIFAAQDGQEVTAVAGGQVVYSDWLRGFGMLMIIDHGNQYMSLYGQNTSLHKESGDWVQAQEVVASAGSSGGFQQNGLYFELRHKGKPINPAKWLKH